MILNKTFALIITILTLSSFAQEIQTRTKDRYQIGFETNSGFAQIERASFTSGLDGGTFVRLKNHQFGIRGTFYSELQFSIFGENNLFQSINTYYGYLFYFPRISFGPQFGGGYFLNEDDERNPWHRYNFVGALYFSFTSKGMGFNIRPFYSWNPKYQYYGVSIGGTFGRTWK